MVSAPCLKILAVLASVKCYCLAVGVRKSEMSVLTKMVAVLIYIIFSVFI